MRFMRRLLLGVAAATVVAVVAVPSALSTAPATTYPCVQPPAGIVPAQAVTQDELMTSSYPWVQRCCPARTVTVETEAPAVFRPTMPRAEMSMQYPWVQPPPRVAFAG